MTRTLIIIPLFNEAGTVDHVIDGVQTSAPDADVLVVDDGSTDASPAILAARPEVSTVRHPENAGYGASLITGFRHAVESAYEVAVTIDCDEQHEPSRIPEFRAAIMKADIVSGSRYLDPAMPGDPAPADRLELNREFTALLRTLTGFPITDAWCGFKAYRTAALRRFTLDEPSYGMPLQVWIQAAALGLAVRELPVARIYKNPARAFWGGLDDAAARRAYYRRVLEAEVSRWMPEKLDLLQVRR
jgi:dolichol-phosphate mannosyltransferase